MLKYQVKLYYIQISFLIILCPVKLFRAQPLSNSLFNIPEIEITVNNHPFDDYLFLGLTAGGAGHLLIVDNDATPVFYKIVDGTIFNFLWQENGELTYNIYPDSAYGLDSSGTLVNRFYTPEPYGYDFHELTVLEDGTYYVLGDENISVDLSEIVPGGNPKATLITQNIYQMDANDNEIWSWRSIEHYDLTDVDDDVSLLQIYIDWSHCNSIKVDYDGNILLSTRNFDEVTKINRQTGDIIWRLGGEQNQFKFINDTRRFARQHDVKRNSEGNLILFDNGVRLDPQYSSLVEYALDEDSLTATLVRRFSIGDTLWSRIRGGVQGLSNGDHLIDWGERNNPAVTEINKNNEIVYEIRFPNGGHRYRSFRFPWKTNYFYVNTDSLNFGTLSLGDSSYKKLWVKNTREDIAIINEFYLKDQSFAISNELPISIPKNDSVKLVVMFKPYDAGYFHNKLNIRYVKDSLLLGRQVDLYGTANKVVNVENNSSTINEFSLSQNYPNPFNPSTYIGYRIKDQEFVSLKVYNVLGKEIATLVNEEKPAGNYKIEFNSNSNLLSGKSGNLPSGIYFYRLKAGSFISVKKMILMK